MFTEEDLKKFLDEADAIVIGAGAGLSTSAGAEYGGDTFMKGFKHYYDEYGYRDLYSLGFHDFDTPEEKWAMWAKMIKFLRYSKPLAKYRNLFELVRDKNYFVITTNVDHEFQRAGFSKERMYYMQGDYGLFQCSVPCHNKTYDNEKMVDDMIAHTKDYMVDSAYLPRCPICGALMETNLRSDEKFVEDDGWKHHEKLWTDFMSKNWNKKILYLELGVGYSTPVWIKYPFMKFTYRNPDARYVVMDLENPGIPKEINKQSLFIRGDIFGNLERIFPNQCIMKEEVKEK